MWRNWNSNSLLERTENGVLAVEYSTMVPQKVENRITI